MNKTGNIVSIGLGEFHATKRAGDVIKTFALGSCVSVIMLDPKTQAIAMGHVVLPESSIDPEKAMSQPGYFADTAIPAMIQRLASLGANPAGKGFVVKLIGGSNVLDSNNVFNIGKRNVLSCRKVLWQLKLAVVAEDVGGEGSRTVELFQSSGRIAISCPGKGVWEI